MTVVGEIAIVGLIVWMAVAVKLPMVLPRLTVLHAAVIIATVLTMLGLCVAIIFSFQLGLPREWVRLSVSYVLGMQLVAGIAAAAMLYRYNGTGIIRRGRRRNDPSGEEH